MSLKLDKKGSPIGKIKLLKKLDNKSYPSKVKDSIWANIDKPYLKYPFRKKRMHVSIESAYFYTRPQILGDGNYANLGVFKGFSTSCFAYGLKSINGKGKVYAIDLFNFMPPEEIRSIYKELELEEYLKICKGYTHEWPDRLKDVSFKFIFIDADHNYETCKQDFELWSPLLAPDGQIAFHDTDIVGVDKVIRELSDDWELVEHCYSIKTFRKKT